MVGIVLRNLCVLTISVLRLAEDAIEVGEVRNNDMSNSRSSICTDLPEAGAPFYSPLWSVNVRLPTSRTPCEGVRQMFTIANVFVNPVLVMVCMSVPNLLVTRNNASTFVEPFTTVKHGSVEVCVSVLI